MFALSPSPITVPYFAGSRRPWQERTVYNSAQGAFGATVVQRYVVLLRADKQTPIIPHPPRGVVQTDGWLIVGNIGDPLTTDKLIQ